MTSVISIIQQWIKQAANHYKKENEIIISFTKKSLYSKFQYIKFQTCGGFL
jgi:hypothetical protein